MRLFHVSEEAGITQFEPRPSPSPKTQLEQPAVWAIAEETLWTYLLPRDCPRIAYRYNPQASEYDVSTYLHGDRHKRVLAIESGWFDRCCTTKLYCYEFNAEPFSLYDQHALYYLAYTSVQPVAVSVITQPLKAIMQRGVDVYLLPELWDLRELIVQTTLSWGFIRMRNAAPPARGYDAYLPV